MTEQEENEAICLRLLGWIKVANATQEKPAVWHEKLTATTGRGGMYTPTFTDWAEAGLILDTLFLSDETVVEYTFIPIDRAGCMSGFRIRISDLRDPFNPINAKGATGPLAIRSAALEYIRSMK